MGQTADGPDNVLINGTPFLTIGAGPSDWRGALFFPYTDCPFETHHNSCHQQANTVQHQAASLLPCLVKKKKDMNDSPMPI